MSVIDLYYSVVLLKQNYAFKCLYYSRLCRKLAGRAEGLGVDRALIEKWSKSGCEARLLCETAIREDSLDVDRVKKLFWNFVSQ